jgi:hypothetical protein
MVNSSASKVIAISHTLWTTCPAGSPEVQAWLEDLDTAFGMFVDDMTPCPADEIEDVLTASIDLLIVRRQEYRDAMALAESEPNK